MNFRSLSMDRPVCILGLDCGMPFSLENRLLSMREIFLEADEILAARSFLAKLHEDAQLGPRSRLLAFPVAKVVERISANIAAVRKTLILTDGDPLFYGLGASLLRYFDASTLQIIPAVSSLQTACARLGLPWHDVACVSLHGRPELEPLFCALHRQCPVCVLFGNGPGPDALARLLLDRGIASRKAFVFAALGAELEESGEYSLEECARACFPDCSLMLLMPLAQQTAHAEIFGKYHSSDPVAAMIMNLLDPEINDVVWDVGSGTGSVAMRLSRIAFGGPIYAIEKEAGRILDIQLNRHKRGAANVAPIFGEAPDVLAKLPTPRKIFIGGGLSGAKGKDLLEYCANRLASGGRLAASCILLGSLDLCRQFIKTSGWAAKIWQIQASEAASLGSGERLKAHNPVFVLTIEKPRENGVA